MRKENKNPKQQQEKKIKLKIAIICPVYDAEKYLRRNLDTTLNQTLKEIKMIYIEDKSPDNCKNILEEYSKKDKRIVFLQNEKNMGPGPTRNRGIDYLFKEMKEDADDHYTEKNSLERIYNYAKKTNSDVTEFDCKIIEVDKGNKEYIYPFNVKEETYDGKCLRVFSGANFLFASIRTAIYRKELLKDIRITNHSFAEDVFVKYKIISMAKKLTVFPEKHYVYYSGNPESLMNKTSCDLKGKDLKEQITDIVKFWKEKKIYDDPELRSIMINISIFLFWTFQPPATPLSLEEFNKIYDCDISDKKYYEKFDKYTQNFIDSLKSKKK